MQAGGRFTSGRRFRRVEKSVFRLKMQIFSLGIYIFKVEIYISSLEIKNFAGNPLFADFLII